MPEVNELRNTFQYQPLPENPTKFDPKSVFRHPCIVKTIRYILSGESVISTGFRSKKARNAHSELWHVTQVTPSLIVFAVMIIDFVLSGEASLERSSASSDYLEFWQGRFEFFDDLYERHPRILDDFMMFHNRSALPHLFPPDADADDLDGEAVVQPSRGLTQQDVLALENMA
ncbi:hypothetical protein FS749_003535 [Ceratobasidium sp. UAMH 11750]|nr:hypothetical protein FS749_003535 [Ceratobasidium sp. UAMH 11750]